MRILYVAKHGSGGSDDEGAIAFALKALGHEVNCMVEDNRRQRSNWHNWIIDAAKDVDLLLFHKWQDHKALERIREQYPKVKIVFWYFDLVAWPGDDTLKSRSLTRIGWMNTFVPRVDLGFCTDGDFVLQDPTGKLMWLPQGADERIVGRGTRRPGIVSKPLLFTGGIKNGGIGRNKWFDAVIKRYGAQLTHYTNGIYREELRDAIASHCIVLAPDAPVTGAYWSNRVWNALGFGAFMLHPFCRNLTQFFPNGGEEIQYYTDIDEMFQMIDHWLPQVELRHEVGDRAIKRIREIGLYRHRCEELLQVVKERLGVG